MNYKNLISTNRKSVCEKEKGSFPGGNKYVVLVVFELQPLMEQIATMSSSLNNKTLDILLNTRLKKDRTLWGYLGRILAKLQRPERRFSTAQAITRKGMPTCNPKGPALS